MFLTGLRRSFSSASNFESKFFKCLSKTYFLIPVKHLYCCYCKIWYFNVQSKGDKSCTKQLVWFSKWAVSGIAILLWRKIYFASWKLNMKLYCTLYITKFTNISNVKSSFLKETHSNKFYWQVILSYAIKWIRYKRHSLSYFTFS